MRQSLDAAVVQVAVADVEAALGGERFLIDLELVVLRGDRDAPGAHVLDRMVRAVMSEGQTRGRRSDRAREQLMTEADAEDRQWMTVAAGGRGVEQKTGGLDRGVEARRIAGAVG